MVESEWLIAKTRVNSTAFQSHRYLSLHQFLLFPLTINYQLPTINFHYVRTQDP